MSLKEKQIKKNITEENSYEKNAENENDIIEKKTVNTKIKLEIYLSQRSGLTHYEKALLTAYKREIKSLDEWDKLLNSLKNKRTK